MLPRNDFERAIQRIAQNDPTLTQFSLGFWATLMSDTKIPALARALQTNTHLRTLDLSWTVINPHASELARALAENKGLRSLDLRYSSLSDAELFIISVDIRKSQSLRELRLAHRSKAVLLSHPMPQFTSFAYNRFVELGDDFNDHLLLIAKDDGSHVCLGHALLMLLGSKIEKLDLDNTKLSDLDVAYLSLFIASSSSLKELKLKYRSLPASHLKMLAAGLKHNQSLRRFDIYSTCDEGEKYLVAVLQNNRVLESIKIEHSAIGGEVEDALLAALKDNDCLLNLDIFRLSTSRHREMLKEYLVRNRIRKLNRIISQAGLIADDGTLSAAAFVVATTAVADFIKQNSELALARQLPAMLDSLKNILEGKSVKLNIMKLAASDARVRSMLLHIYAQQLMIHGDFLRASTLMDEEYMTPRQSLLLTDALLRDEDLSTREDILTIEQRCQLGFVLLRNALADDRADMITLRRLIMLRAGIKGESVPSLQYLTAADHVVTFRTCVLAFIALEAVSENDEFKASIKTSKVSVSEANFQTLIGRMKAEIINLRKNNIQVPAIAIFLEQFQIIRCYEMIALDPAAIGSNIESIIRNQTRALRSKEMAGDVLSNYTRLCQKVDKNLETLKEIVKSNFFEELASIIIRAIDAYLPMSASQNRMSILQHRNTLSTQPTLEVITEVVENIEDNALKQLISEELRRDDLVNCLNKNKLQVIIADAVKGIKFYSHLDRKSLFKSHLNLFSILFDNDRGLLRAKAYERYLLDPNRDLNDKAMVLYALLTSNDGKKLQECVRNHIGFDSVIIDALANYLKSQDENIKLDNIARDVFRVANNKPDESIDLGVIATQSYISTP